MLQRVSVWLRILTGLSGFALLLLFSGCGVTTVIVTTAPPAAVLTVTPATPTTVPVTAAEIMACFGGPHPASEVIRYGDLIISSASGGFYYRQKVLPTSAGLVFPLTGNATDNFAASFTGDVLTSDTGKPFAAGVITQVCNTSTAASHSISALNLTTTSATPSSAMVSVWGAEPCATSYYNTASGVIHEGGCGGAYGPGFERFTANFTSDPAVGASVPETPLAMSGTTLPVPVSPSATVTFVTDLTLTSAGGTYQFAPVLTIDGKNITVPATEPIMFAYTAHKYDGESCDGNPYFRTAATGNYICRKS